MDLFQELAEERRARLAAERLLAQKLEELAQANDVISQHALSLTGQVIEKREEAEALRGENETVKSDLQSAREAEGIARRRLWSSLETIEDGFAVFDRDDRLVAANRAYLIVFDGLDTVAPGIAYPDLLQLGAEEGVFDTEGKSRDTWVAGMLKRWRGAEIANLNLRLWNGEVIRLIDRRTHGGDTVTLALNITESIRREEELQAARDRAEAASRAKSAFLANMSHEIRTPMNGVVAMAELLVESGVSEEQALYVQTIRNSGEALLTIINDVLDFSKIEANKLELRPRPFDLERTIHEIMTLLQPTAKGKEIELVVDYDMFLPTSFVGDPGRVRQVLTNLIGNAVKFTPSGHVMVRTVGLPAEGNAHRIHITVEDTGIGIGDEQLEHIFGEFNQAESSKSRSFDGTGLGLAISRQLVRLMGGEVWVDSELGKGSSFGFHLVLPEAEGPAAADVTRPDWIDRAFIIDKSAAARPILEKQLRAVGISPITCDAVEEFERMDPTPNDLVIVAHDPPRIDAVALSKRLVAEARSSAILILSGGILTLDPALKSHVSVRQRPVLRSEIWEHLAALKKHSPVALAVPEPEPASDITEVQTASSSGHQERRRIRVLAAEDNKTNQLIFSKMLKTLDIELTFANNGREAVEGFLKDRPDIIFTDISMPEMDGKEATRRIRKLEAEADARPVPIVAMTAHAMDSDEIEILASGVDRCLTKPLKKADLVEAIVDAAPEGTLPAISEGATADVA